LVIGAVFGLARGLAVLIGARVRTVPALYSFHRRFDAWAAPVRQTVIGVELAVAVAAAWIVAPALVATGVSIAAVALLAWTNREWQPDLSGGLLHVGQEVEPSKR
jgi:hypothetical protein